MPVTPAEQKDTTSSFRKICGFRNVTGAIDCTHIKIRQVPGGASQYYINRKGYYSLNVHLCASEILLRIGGAVPTTVGYLEKVESRSDLKLENFEVVFWKTLAMPAPHIYLHQYSIQTQKKKKITIDVTSVQEMLWKDVLVFGNKDFDAC